MTEKLRLAVLVGGQSSEHEVSVVSARSMLAAMDVEQYELTLIGIARDGSWWTGLPDALLAGATVDESLQDCERVVFDFAGGGTLRSIETGLDTHLDCVFPLLHGPCGEDGTVQGLLDLARVPYVGCGVSASAVGMDKSLTKKILFAHGLPQIPYSVVDYIDWHNDAKRVETQSVESLSWPVFVKPANMGSSVGVTRATDRDSLHEALSIAFRYDQRALVEQAVSGCRELECAVLGYHSVRTSVIGEIIPGSDFYDYKTKYVDDSSELVIPARLAPGLADRLRTMAEETFRAVGGAGLARVDFFLDSDDQAYVNEINTMPGFTPISMYPKLWSASNLDYPDLVDELISLALQRHEASARLQNTR